MNDNDNMERLAPEIVISDFGPRLVVKNWDTECALQMYTGEGFPIRKRKSFDNKQQKYIDGIHSVLFGTSWEDENAFRDRYSCKCGKYQGAIYEGEVCPECGEKVGFVDVNLNKFGWIQMNTNYHIINPAMYALLKKFIGAKTLNRIIEWDKDLDSDAHPIEVKDNKNKFVSLGLTGFYKHFYEIMEYYYKRRKKHEIYYWEILKKADCVFASNIPVFSSVLRPLFTSPDLYHYTKPEQAYNVIVGAVNKLNNYDGEIDESNEEAINNLLYTIQQKVLKIDELIFKMIDKKTGHIHEGIFGGRMSFSARDVIVPNPSLHADEIILSYLAVLELYKLEIINLIVKVNGCNYTTALRFWFDAHLKFSPFVYQIMMHLCKNSKYGMICLINRNPTIDFGSFDCMRVVGITQSYDNMTMSIPLQILGKLNADFDGDNLNIYSLKTNQMKKVFDKILNPTKSMFISRNDGFLDTQNFLKKDQLIGLNAFCTI